MTRYLLAGLCLLWMGITMSQNVPNVWDIFDIAAIILGIGTCIVLVMERGGRTRL